jgi:hypothetical protein
MIIFAEFNNYCNFYGWIIADFSYSEKNLLKIVNFSEGLELIRL